ncbi:MAG: cation:proton antiporter regulatory subunit [Gemmatimonadota bacterium]|jgi:TrkA domain protein
MDVREHDLPGVGKKFALRTDEGERITVVIHNTGPREIYQFKGDEDYPVLVVRLSDPEARKLGAILGGAYFQPPMAESMEMILEQLAVEWFELEPGSALAGRTLAQTELRTRTGASVIAILRHGAALPNPQPDQQMEPGDTLLVVGDREQVGRVAELCRGGDEGDR